MVKILFIGCVESSYLLLKKLIENKSEVVGVITKKNSRFNADFFDLAPLCIQHQISYHYVENINDGDSIEFIKKCNSEIAFCFGWSQLVSREIINLFPKGIVGFHPAALPQNRGRHPLIWALALGLSETASTFFMINVGADEGEIVSQKRIHITYEDDARTLYDKIMEVAIEQEVELVQNFEHEKVRGVTQFSKDGNSWRKRGKADGKIDWRMSSRSIYNLVRSLTKPYVGAYFEYCEKEYKVWKAQEIETIDLENLEPGKVLAVNENGTIDIKTGENGIRLIEFDSIMIVKGDYVL